MSTGYTAYIEDGTITTGAEFLLLCTRAFDVAIDLKEEPLSVATPVSFKTNPYYEEAFANACKRLSEATAMTFEDAKAELKKRYEENISYYKKRARELLDINKKYEKIRKEVKNWNPPTTEHVGIKTFALSQISKCMASKSEIERCEKRSEEKLDDSDAAVELFILENINTCKENCDRAYKRYMEELERAKHRTQFMADFMDSIREMSEGGELRNASK